MEPTTTNPEEFPSHTEQPPSVSTPPNAPAEAKTSPPTVTAEASSQPQAQAEPLPASGLAEETQHYDWDQLQEKYAAAMEEHSRAEEDLRGETAKLLEVFASWSQSTALRDENRALKRFKTQTQHVQNSEGQLEKKRQHYADVVNAFESALALLNDRVKP